MVEVVTAFKRNGACRPVSKVKISTEKAGIAPLRFIETQHD
jgi:hypothetical protein